jgi:hypothetical protein
MKSAIKNRAIRKCAGINAVCTVILAVAALAAPARAADAIYPTGSRLGLVPPTGMVTSRNFAGFEDPEKNAAILLNALPAAAYDELDKSMVPEEMRKQGIEVEQREPIKLTVGKAFVLSGKQNINQQRYRKWLLVAAAGDITALVTVQIPEQDTSYSDKAVRDALATLAIRASVPDSERMSLLPFQIGDLAGFKIENVFPGRAVMLIDAPFDKSAAGSEASDKDKEAGASKPVLNARMLIAAIPANPPDTGDRDNFARVAFGQIAGIKEVRVQDAEPLRIGGQPGYQTIAKAKDPQSDADIMVVQWLRFGTGGFLQMIGIARADIWPDMLTRLRAVRDSIDAK